MKVFIEEADDFTTQMFVERGWEITDEPTDADLICFTGGSDVSPILYLEENTHSYTRPTRDLYCVGVWTRAKALDIPCVGICRGGQFLNVMNGGSMVQDIRGHGRDHEVTIEEDVLFDYKGLKFLATSTHHQEIVPDVDHADIIGRASDGVTEVVYYGDTRDLCFQPHPEYSGAEACREPFFDLIEDMMDA